MQIHIGPLMRALAVLAVMPVLAGACVGNPFAPKSSTGQDTEQMRLRWTQCMRQHGITISDPNQSGEVTAGSTPGPGSDTSGPKPDVNSDQLQAAANACKQYQPNGGIGSGRADPKMLDAATKFAQCMRDHGIRMQDPQSSGGGVSIRSGGQGSVDPNSDQFKQAQQTCQHYLDQVRPTSRSSMGS